MNKMRKETALSVLKEIRDSLKLKVYGKSPVEQTDRFHQLPDGWIRDRRLGLDWGPSSSTRMNYAAAEKYVSTLGPGVRLPELEELETLCNRARREPATFSLFINDTKIDDWYWTKTPVAGFSSAVWCVGCNDGSVNDGYKSGNNYVRPVRSSQ